MRITLLTYRVSLHAFDANKLQKKMIVIVGIGDSWRAWNWILLWIYSRSRWMFRRGISLSETLVKPAILRCRRMAIMSDRVATPAITNWLAPVVVKQTVRAPPRAGASLGMANYPTTRGSDSAASEECARPPLERPSFRPASRSRYHDEMIYNANA